MSINHYIVGWSGNIFLQMRGYFNLRKDNAMLNERIAELENRLNAYRSQLPEDIEIGVDLQTHQYITGKVVSNTINRPQNYIVIDKGLSDVRTLAGGLCGGIYHKLLAELLYRAVDTQHLVQHQLPPIEGQEYGACVVEWWQSV